MSTGVREWRVLTIYNVPTLEETIPGFPSPAPRLTPGNRLSVRVPTFPRLRDNKQRYMFIPHIPNGYINQGTLMTFSTQTPHCS
jgi:hypothetical protein